MQPGPAALAGGYRVEAFDLLGSTHDEAMLRARAGDPGKLWIVAQQQSAGRGRMVRPWASPSGNLYASLLLIDPSPVAVSPQLGFVAGVALADAVASMIGPGRALLKWPNDLLLDSAKLAGLLIEATTMPDGLFVCAIGFGVNCTSHPKGLPYPATNLSVHGDNYSAAVLFPALSDAFAHWFDLWSGSKNFAAIRQAWLDRAHPAGTNLRVSAPDRIRVGKFKTIDVQGRLVLDCAEGVITFDAGDVFPVAGAANNQSIPEQNS